MLYEKRVWEVEGELDFITIGRHAKVSTSSRYGGQGTDKKELIVIRGRLRPRGIRMTSKRGESGCNVNEEG